MNIIGIIGSLRKDSVHRQIFNHYKEIASDQFTLLEGSIEGIPLYDGEDTGKLVVDELAKKIADADGVIFFAPEYNYSISGSLKNAIDWLSRCDPQPFAGKPATIVGASPGNAGTARMQTHLRQVGIFLDLHFLNKPEAMIGGVFQKMDGGKITDESTVQFLERHATAFQKFCAHE